MLGNVIGIEDNKVLVKLSVDLANLDSIVNNYVMFIDEDKQMVGEVIDIKDNIAYVNLAGEIIDNTFRGGVILKPSFKSKVELVDKDKIGMILSEDGDESHILYMGNNPIYKGLKINVNVNNFFSHHFAIFGSTGGGKSCGTARIIQNLYDKKNAIAYKSNLIIFDAYGEYHNAFKDINKSNPYISFKAYTTNLEFADTDVLQIPFWLLGVDDIALLLGADTPSQLPIIETALKLVTVFAREEELVLKHKNDIIARALLDIFTSGNSASQTRDHITSVLSRYNTKDLNLETPIFQPGYTRPFRQCLLIDGTGKIRDMELLISFLEKFLDDNLELNLPDGSFPYTIRDFNSALEFSLINEGILKSSKVYDECNVLKTRLNKIVNSDTVKYFEYDEYVTKEDYIRKLLEAPNGKKAQIINFNINYIDDRLAKTIVKMYSKLFYDYVKEHRKDNSMPFHIILEEAHRYVQNDSDNQLLGYNIFERIAKEGRKYGIILGLISQRPCELSETCLSQCNNFLVFKMLHPKDIEYIREMIPNVTTEIIKRLKILQAGTCMAFGLAFKVPMFIKFDMPNPSPSSSSCNLTTEWFMKVQNK